MSPTDRTSSSRGQRKVFWDADGVGNTADDSATELLEDRDRELTVVKDGQAVGLATGVPARFNSSYIDSGVPQRHHYARHAATAGRHGNRDVAGSRIDGKHSLTLLVSLNPRPQREPRPGQPARRFVTIPATVGGGRLFQPQA